MRNSLTYKALTVLLGALISLASWAQTPVKTEGDKGKIAAEKEVKEAIKDNQLLRAVEKYDNGDFEGAAAMLSKIVAADPKYDAAHYYLALTYLLKGETDLAEMELLRAVEIDPGNFWYRQRLAAVYRHSGQTINAISTYEKLLEDFPKKSDLYFDLVELYAQNGDFDKALSTLDTVENIFGTTESIAVYRFRLLMSQEKSSQAYKSLEEYNAKYSSPYILCTLGDYRMSTYEDSLAVAYYDEALSLDGDYAPALLGKAEALRMTRKYDLFFPVLDKYMASEETIPRGKAEYFSALTEKSDPKFVGAFLEKFDTAANICFRHHPTDSAVVSTVASYYYRTGRTEEGIGLYRLNSDLRPDDMLLEAVYLYSLLYADKWEELAQDGAKAAKKFPREPEFLMLSGAGYSSLGEYDKVISLCEEMVRDYPKDSLVTTRAYTTMGDTYFRKKDTKNAFKAYEKVLKISPNNIYVLNNYAYYLSVEGRKLKKAYSMSKKTIEAEPDNATYLDTFGWILYLQGRALEAEPFFKHAMLYGGKDSAVILDHYAEVLFALKKYDLAFVNWYRAQGKNNAGEIPDLSERIAQRKKECGR